MLKILLLLLLLLLFLYARTPLCHASISYLLGLCCSVIITGTTTTDCVLQYHYKTMLSLSQACPQQPSNVIGNVHDILSGFEHHHSCTVVVVASNMRYHLERASAEGCFWEFIIPATLYPLAHYTSLV